MGLNFDKDFSCNKRYSDFYFGMDPEASIRLHFPNDNKWQLLPKIISKDEFKSIAYLDEGFYSIGLKIISPDIQSLNSTKDIKIRLTSDKSFDEIFGQLDFQETKEVKGEMLEFGFFDINKISIRVYEFNYHLYGGFSDIYVENKKTREIFYLIFFDSI